MFKTLGSVHFKAFVLSPSITIGSDTEKPSSLHKILSQNITYPASAMATYSTSEELCAETICFPAKVEI